MKFGSLCALGGFTPYPVMSALNAFPRRFPAIAAVAEAAEYGPWASYPEIDYGTPAIRMPRRRSR